VIFCHWQESEVSAVKYISYEEYKRLLAKEDSDYVPYDVNGQYSQLFDVIEKRYVGIYVLVNSWYTIIKF